jgi:organic radical activating enzyme
MWNPKVVAKGIRTTQRRRASGEIVPSVRTLEQRSRYSAAKMGDKNPMKRHAVRLKNALSHRYKKSNLELRFQKTFKALGIKAKYIGNTGELVVGDDKVGYRLPDFFLGANKVVETYDTTFDRYKEGVRTRSNYERPVKAFYKKFGYDCLFLTNEDFPRIGSGNQHDLTTLQPIKEKVGLFLRNGAQIVSVSSLTTSCKGKFAPEGTSRVVNFSCHPYNTFLVGGLHTHNCDTSFHFDDGKWMTFDEIFQDYQKQTGPMWTAEFTTPDNPTVFKGQHEPLIVVTGGEPMLQNNLVKFCEEAYHRNGLLVQIETNGSRLSTADACADQYAFVVVSPKASHKGYGDLTQLSNWIANRQYTAAKFVLSADPSDPHHEIPAEILTSAFRYRSKVYISPIAVYKRPYTGEVVNAWDATLLDHEKTAANYRYAAKYVMENPGLTLSIQQHLFCTLA